MDMHPNDAIAALQWAVGKAQAEAETSDYVRLAILPHLREMHRIAQAESRK